MPKKPTARAAERRNTLAERVLAGLNQPQKSSRRCGSTTRPARLCSMPSASCRSIT